MTADPSPSTPRLPDALRLGAVHLTVTDVDRSVAWYQRALGLRVHRHDPTEAALGTGGEDLLVLHEDATAAPAGRHAGLYHYALLFGTREELARTAVRLGATRTPVQGASDHGTHEAIYLPDPDGNGIELAADRPRDQWPLPEDEFSEFSRGGPRPLDMDDLLRSVEGEEPSAQAAPGLAVGHLHLHVGDIDRGLAFYRDVVGFDVWAQLPSAAFVSAGGYHHHLAFNVWRGPGVPPMPDGTVGLRHWTVVLESAEQVDELRRRAEAAGADVAGDAAGELIVRDPWDMALRVTAADAGA